MCTLNHTQLIIEIILEMKRLMNLVKDGVLVTLITSSLAGSPDSERQYINDLEKRLNNAKIYNSYLSNDYKSVNVFNILEETYKKVNVPEYVTIDVQLARSYVESSNNPNAVSPAGAKGLFQIMEDSWKDIMKEPFEYAGNPYMNSIASLKHISIVDKFLKENYPGFDSLDTDKKLDLLNAAYNGGHGRLKSLDWDISKMPKETKDYVKRMKERTALERTRLSYKIDNYKY